MIKTLLATLVVFAGLLSANAQHVETRNCPAEEILDRQNKNPKIRQNRASIERRTQRFLKEGGAHSHRSGTLTIPVVVHVIYRNAQENISDAQIQSQIDVLTEDFRRLNADASSTPAEFAPFAVDSDMEFVLAQVTRTSSSRTSWGTNDAMKLPSQGGVAPIDPSENLNVWVCNIGGGILGYAQFPGGSASTDGVVISPQYFGSRSKQQGGQNFYLSAPFDQGRTATHEVGHYLNLRHIWGDGNCNADDFVSDTPNAGGPNYGCPGFPSKSCSSNGGYSSDMFMNYMDYTDDACMNMFSAGQLARMNALFEPGGARESLGFIGAGCTLPAPSGLSSSNVGDNSFSLSWSAVSGAISYTVNIDGNTSVVAGTSTSVSGLTGGTTYSVSVRANCASGSGPYSSAINVTTTGSNCRTGANLTLITDNYGSETSWTLTRNGSTVASGSGYANNTTYTENFDFGAGSYVFTINDSYGDGICCSYGNGSYTITDGSGSTIASGGQFTTTDAASWCLEGGAADTQAPTAPSSVSASGITSSAANISWNASSDNVGVTGYDVSVNGSAVGTTTATSYTLSGLSAGTSYSVSVVAKDAAGNTSAAGSTSFTTQSSGGPSAQTLIGSTFETGLEGWLDGGSDVFRYSGSRSYEGSYSIRLRDNSGTASAMTTAATYNVTSFDQITIDFYFYAYSMENGEDFWVRYNDGTGWVTVASYARGTDFNNNTFYNATINLSSADYNFPSNARFRIQCDASANGDQVYIDQVTISASSGARNSGNTLTALNTFRTAEPGDDNFLETDGISIYPNPAASVATMMMEIDEATSISMNVINIEGRIVKSMQTEAAEGVMTYEMDVNDLPNGLYFVKVVAGSGQEIETQKLIVNR